MPRRFKDLSLYQQLVIPMLLVGVIGVLVTIRSAIEVENSVVALGEMYHAGDERLRSLEEIEKSLSYYRALSLQHLASEKATRMESLYKELMGVKAQIQRQLSGIADISNSERDGESSKIKALELLVNQYFLAIDGALQQSGDFEKEIAFEQLTKTENLYMPDIGRSISSLIRTEFEEIDYSRSQSLAAANRNLHITIALGIVGGGLLLLIAFVVIRRITLRLSHLLEWSREVSAGILDAPLAAGSADEVGQLTVAMKDMANSIYLAHAALADAKRLAEDSADEIRLYANAFENSGEAILISDRSNQIIDINSAFTAQTGYSKKDVLGSDPRIFASGDTPKSVYREMWNDLGEKGYWQGELWDRKKSGEIYPKWAAISAIHNDVGEVMFYVASYTDISERKAAEARIEHLAHHDILTGLLNRFSLEDRLEQALVMAERSGQQVAVMFIDLDRFKSINDTLGHQIGDELLVQVAERLSSAVRNSDIVSRIGGDEFVVVLTSLEGSTRAAVVAEDIRLAIIQPYHVAGHELETSPSIGISVFPDDGMNAGDLLKCADVAMYHAKELGRNNFYFFTESMLVEAKRKAEMEHELRLAIDTGQFVLHYQPQVSSWDYRVCGVEALLRWNHPVRGEISPETFIPIAEETGVIHALGAWVIDEACRQLATWKACSKQRFWMAINVSVKQLQSEELVEQIQSAMTRHGLGAGDLELEITESAAMQDIELSISRLGALRRLGVGLAIDDFGTGYSSLAYLKRLPIQTLKLDRTFVRDIEYDQSDTEISAATLALAHNLGLKVVAEGVETQAQSQFLIANNCDYLQGYYFSKPLPANEFARYIDADSLDIVSHT